MEYQDYTRVWSAEPTEGVGGGGKTLETVHIRMDITLSGNGGCATYKLRVVSECILSVACPGECLGHCTINRH